MIISESTRGEWDLKKQLCGSMYMAGGIRKKKNRARSKRYYFSNAPLIKKINMPFNIYNSPLYKQKKSRHVYRV